MLTALAAFAEVFTNPAAPALVLALACLLRGGQALRLAALVLGLAFAAPSLLHGPGAVELAATLVGACAALLLHAEVVLHFVLPAARWLGHLMAAAWRVLAAAWAWLAGSAARPAPPIEPEP